VALTINESAADSPTPVPAEGPLGPSDHQRLADAVRDEILTWTFRDFISAFRRWHRGSFSMIHLKVLTMLDTDGPASMSHLAEALDVSVASMTGIVDRMERRGLVERRHEEKDRRVVLVVPTQAGLDVFREIDERRRSGLGKVLGQLSRKELEGLLRGHRALHAARSRAASADDGVAADADTPMASRSAPSRLHRRSTIAPEDPPVHPLTGADR